MVSVSVPSYSIAFEVHVRLIPSNNVSVLDEAEVERVLLPLLVKVGRRPAGHSGAHEPEKPVGFRHRTHCFPTTIMAANAHRMGVL